MEIHVDMDIIIDHMINSCGVYSINLVPHPSTILRGQYVTSMTEVCRSLQKFAKEYNDSKLEKIDQSLKSYEADIFRKEIRMA